jgi:hypothetical protein
LERTAQQLSFNRLVEKTDTDEYKDLLAELKTEEGTVGGLSPGDTATELMKTGTATLKQLRREGLRLHKKQRAHWQRQRASTNGTGGASQHETADTVGIPETASTMPGSWISAPTRPG